MGGGDSAMEEALYLSRLGRKVEVVHRRDSLRASKIMQERAFKNSKIAFIWDTTVDDVLDPAAGKVTAVRLRNLKTGARWESQVDGLFIAIGHQPNTALFKGQIELLPNEYIKVVPRTTRTSVPGVFAAGDVQDFTYRQAVTAASTGCMAALEAERYLEAQAWATDPCAESPRAWLESTRGEHSGDGRRCPAGFSLREGRRILRVARPGPIRCRGYARFAPADAPRPSRARRRAEEHRPRGADEAAAAASPAT